MVRPVVAGTMGELETEPRSTRAEVAADPRRLADQLETGDADAGWSVELELNRPREVVA
jgi:hypothetical protein